MSLLERARATATTVRGAVGSPRRALVEGWRPASFDWPWAAPEQRWRGLLAGAVPVGLGLLACMLVVVPLWAITGSGASWAHAVGVAAACWLLVSGGGFGADGVSVSLVPVLGWAGAVWLVAHSLRRAAALADRPTLGLAPLALGGYAAAQVVVALLALAGPARPTLGGLVTSLGVPVTALLLDQARDPDEWVAERLPTWLTRAGRPALWGLAGLGSAALLLVLVQLVGRWSTVSGLYAALGTGMLASLVLTLLQLLFLPDLLVWALAVLSGPGFQVSAGGTVSLGGAQPGLLPMIPALGLLPPDGTNPGWAWLGLLVPVAVGVGVGRQATASWSRLADWRSRAATTGAAVGLVAVAVLVLAALSSGSAGEARLAHVGVQPLAVAAALLGELALGAALWLGWDTLRRRRIDVVD